MARVEFARRTVNRRLRGREKPVLVRDNAPLAVKLWIASSVMNWCHSGVARWVQFVQFLSASLLGVSLAASVMSLPV